MTLSEQKPKKEGYYWYYKKTTNGLPPILSIVYVSKTNEKWLAQNHDYHFYISEYKVKQKEFGFIKDENEGQLELWSYIDDPILPNGAKIKTEPFVKFAKHYCWP